MNKKHQKSNPTREDVNAYFSWSAETGVLCSFTNKDLVCHDCVNLIKDNLVSCKIYNVKPDHIYYDKGCENYEKE